MKANLKEKNTRLFFLVPEGERQNVKNFGFLVQTFLKKAKFSPYIKHWSNKKLSFDRKNLFDVQTDSLTFGDKLGKSFEVNKVSTQESNGKLSFLSRN